MQVLLENKNIDFKNQVEDFISRNLKATEDIDLKLLWQNLFKEGIISKENNFFQNVLLAEALCKFKPGIGLFLLTQFACIETIRKFASENLMEKYLNRLISGEIISCFSITEPNAGSDVSMIETFAKKEGNKWILNGHKIWASNGSISDIIITFARTKLRETIHELPQREPQRDKSGITCFIIPSRCKEVEILKDTPKLGVEITPSNEVLIKNLMVDEQFQIGNIGDGIKMALGTIVTGRIFCAAQAVGLLSGILEESIKHSTKRNQFGKSISDYQAIKWYIADMTKDLDGARLLLYKAAWAKENRPEELNKLSSMAKYFCTSTAQKHSSNAVQIFGGAGLIKDSYVACAYRDSKVLEIYEGTNEIQRLVIAREIL